MSQEKIGKFIAKCRKDVKLTQEQLAEKLEITYKAVSKWECGKSLPDASLMMDLCNILQISVNELLSGEKISKELFNDKADENLVKLSKEKEFGDKASKYAYSITVILLLIWNVINIITIKDANEAISRPEFIIMDTATFIWFAIYTHLLGKQRKNK
jgi:transcriptional regulator with XRE-family HTH domain